MSGIDYRAIFRAADEPLLVCDAEDGRIHDANARLGDLLGRDPGALTGSLLTDLVAPVNGQPSPLDACDAQSSETAPATVVCATDLADGPRQVELQLSALSESHLLVSVSRSAASTAAAGAARSSVLAQLVEHTPDVMWMFSADWEEYIFVNSAYSEVFGRSLATLREEPSDFLEGVHPADRDDVLDAMARLSDGAEVDIEYRVDKSSDYERWVWVHGVPIRDDDGEVYRVAGFVREITDRHERQLELLHQRNLVQNVPVGVFRVSIADGQRFEQVNPALVSMLDADDPADLLGRDVTTFYHDADLGTDIADRLGRDGVATFEARFETLADNVFWGRVTAIRQTDDSGRQIADGVIEDITPRKHRQRQLRVVDRILRHNIRNDVSVISGYASYLDETGCAAESDAIDSIVQRSQQLLSTAEKGHVVVDVLSDAREPDTFDVVPDVERTIERLRAAHDAVESETALPETSTVTALREIDLALRELLENSVVHHEGRPSVDVAVVSTDDTVEIRITDDGPGIPEREYEILSGTADVDPLSHGSGMGLWLVHWIVRLSGGDISFESSADGSTVVIVLPAGDEPAVRSPDEGATTRR